MFFVSIVLALALCLSLCVFHADYALVHYVSVLRQAVSNRGRQ